MKHLIKILCCWIPSKKYRKIARQKLNEKLFQLLNRLMSTEQKMMLADNQKDGVIFFKQDYFKIQNKYNEFLYKLKNKIKNGQKIDVCFVVNAAQVFPARTVFENMINDNIFNPFILVVPLNIRNTNRFKTLADKTFDELSSQYKGRVYKGYDSDYNDIDFSDKIDIVFTPSNDEFVEPKNYKIYHFIKKGILSIYCPYAWHVGSDKSAFTNDTVNFLWKYISENTKNLAQIKKESIISGTNAVLIGCVKVDKLEYVKKVNRNRKRIIIAPHHSVKEIGLCSRFLFYADFFLELPNLYPDIEFIFRPHPCLIPNLEDESIWGIQKTAMYIEKMKSFKNVVFDEGAEYFEYFVNSDGIIHDCGSFLPEYLLTGNPCCYLLKSNNTQKQYFNEFGQDCLQHYYHAFCKEDIINFIDDVVLNGNDPMRKERNDFINNCMKINYPNAGKIVVEYIKAELYERKG